MKATKFATYLLQILIVGMLLLAFLPVMPASAATTTLTITVSETMSRADTYVPNPTTGGTETTGTLSGTGTVTIHNSLTNTDLYDVTVNMVQAATSASSWVQTGGPTGVIGTPSGGNIPIHFAKIGKGASATFTYAVDPLAAHLPLDFSTSYSVNKVPAVNGQQTVVTMTLNKDETTSGQNTITNIAVKVSNAITASPAVWTFTPGTGTTVDGSNNVNWTATNMAHGAAAQTATYTATVSNAAQFTNANALALYNMANAYISYQINGGTQTTSGVTVSGSPTAVTQNVGTDVQKVYVPGTGYQFTPKVINNNAAPDNVDFTLSAVNFWIVNNQDVTTPTDQKTVSGLPATVTAGSTWTASSAIVEAVTYVPAGFIKPTLSIADANNQITRTYTSSNGLSGSNSAVTMLKEIYILNGYQIEVTKTVVEDAVAGTFDITLTVKNTGTKISPDVYVYDIVPSAWYSTTLPSPTGFSQTPVNTITGTSVSNPIQGYAYYWDCGNLAGSGGTKTITYKVIGPANYQISQVYVVGVDPAQSVNIQTTPLLSNMSTMATANFESLAALGAAGLLVVGMIGNFRRNQ